MQRLTTNDLVTMCQEVTSAYDDACRTFFGRPSKEGIARKVALLQVVSRLHNYSPSEAFVMLYMFYKKEEFDSRLITLLRKRLGSLVGVNIPRLILNARGGNARQFVGAISLFEQKAAAIQKEIGVKSGRDVILHPIIKQ